jgi:hypothetical protein
MSLPVTYSWTIQAEQVINGGFNVYSGTSKIPTRWTQANLSTLDGKDTSIKQESLASVKIIGQSAKTKTLTQTPFNLSGAKGDVLILSFYARTSKMPTDTRLCQAQVTLYLTTGAKQIGKVKCIASNIFRPYSMKITALAAYSKVEVQFIYSKASGTVWFDGVSLLK